MSGMEQDPWKVSKEAHALTVFRVLPNGEGRQYTATTFPKGPYQGCERMIRIGRITGLLKPSDALDVKDIYAVLDVLDAEGQIIQDFAIPNARAHRFWYRKLDLRVEHDEDEGGS